MKIFIDRYNPNVNKIESKKSTPKKQKMKQIDSEDENVDYDSILSNQTTQESVISNHDFEELESELNSWKQEAMHCKSKYN